MNEGPHSPSRPAASSKAKRDWNVSADRSAAETPKRHVVAADKLAQVASDWARVERQLAQTVRESAAELNAQIAKNSELRQALASIRREVERRIGDSMTNTQKLSADLETVRAIRASVVAENEQLAAEYAKLFRAAQYSAATAAMRLEQELDLRPAEYARPDPQENWRAAVRTAMGTLADLSGQGTISRLNREVDIDPWARPDAAAQQYQSYLERLSEVRRHAARPE